MIFDKWLFRNGRRRPAPVEPGPDLRPVEITAERRQVLLPSLSHDERRGMIEELGQRADSLGCVVFEGDPSIEASVVIFAGNQERFHMLSAAAGVSCKVIYLQDRASGWYQGSDVLPDLAALCRGFLADELRGRPALFFGQSSGAYAALVASTYFRDSTVVACAPQTRSDVAIKANLHFVGVRALPTPEGLVSVRERLLAAADANASTTIVLAVSEAQNPVHAHFWMDYFHAIDVWDVPGVRVSVVNAHGHAIVHGNVAAYATLLKQLTVELGAPAERRDQITRLFLEGLYARHEETSP